VRVRFEWFARESITLDAALADERLSFRAKGLLAYLMSDRDRGFDLRQLQAVASEGVAALRTALAELEVAGFVERRDAIDEPASIEPSVEASNAVPVPVMDSLFGESFAPPIPIDELPDAQAEPRAPEDEAAERIIRRLNDLRESSWEWAHYTPLLARYPKNTEKIKQRLREGHDERELILVLEYRAAVDGGDERSRRYFNSDTPFNTRNFEENLALALDWDARGRTSDPGRRLGTERGPDYYLKRRGRDE